MDSTDRFIESLNSPERIDNVWRKLEDKRSYVDYRLKQDDDTEITILSEYIDAAQEYVDNFGKVTGLRSGYDSVDDLTKGMKGGDLIVVAGQPSHGKTLVGNNIAYRMAKAGTPVLFVTLEMTKAKVTARFMQIAKADGKDPLDLPIYYQEVDWVSAKDIPLLIRKAIKEAEVECVIIDHLHYLADRTARDMRMEIGSITKSMKQCAVLHNIPIIMLAQVRRLEDDQKRPRSSDLKETGYIEQDADIILMIWRDISVNSPNPNAVEIYCTKNRDNGFTSDRVKYFFQDGSTLYEEGAGKQVSINDPFLN